MDMIIYMIPCILASYWPLRTIRHMKVPFGNDGDYSEEGFQNRVNSNLANEVGNLAMRTLSMAVKNCGGVPRPGGEEGKGDDVFTAEDEALLGVAAGCLGVVRPLVAQTQQLHKAVEAILQVGLGRCRGRFRQGFPCMSRCSWNDGDDGSTVEGPKLTPSPVTRGSN